MIEQAFDLRIKKNLKDFFNKIKHIQLPKDLLTKAKNLKIDPYPEIKTLSKLYDSIFDKNYKIFSMMFDIPSNSQIFGHIALEAGIQAIIYPSKFTKKSCLAVFPQNFENTDSFLEITDAPQSLVKSRNNRLDKSNFIKFI